jgi:hypothetical protein
MARRGRKRKSGDRYDCGKLKPQQPEALPPDRGTPEVQRRRAGMQGETGCQVNLLVARGVLSNEQAEAGERFAVAYRALWGDLGAPATRYQEYIPGEPSFGPRDNAALQHAYYSARRAIMRAGRVDGMRAERAVRIVFVEGRSVRRGVEPYLVLGLAELARHYGLTARRKAA